jgi:hypothetical protein
VAIRPFTVVVVVIKRITLIKIYVNQRVEQVFVARDGDCKQFLFICISIFRDD